MCVCGWVGPQGVQGQVSRMGQGNAAACNQDGGGEHPPPARLHAPSPLCWPPRLLHARGRTWTHRPSEDKPYDSLHSAQLLPSAAQLMQSATGCPKRSNTTLPHSPAAAPARVKDTPAGEDGWKQIRGARSSVAAPGARRSRRRPARSSLFSRSCAQAGGSWRPPQTPACIPSPRPNPMPLRRHANLPRGLCRLDSRPGGPFQQAAHDATLFRTTLPPMGRHHDIPASTGDSPHGSARASSARAKPRGLTMLQLCVAAGAAYYLL